MAAQGDLSHDPPSTWKCWTQVGHDGAASSNLYLGETGASAIAGYMADTGVPSAGHRRWIIYSAQRVMGSGSTSSSNALYVFGSQDGSDDETSAPSAVHRHRHRPRHLHGHRQPERNGTYSAAPTVTRNLTVSSGPAPTVGINGASNQTTTYGKTFTVSGTAAPGASGIPHGSQVEPPCKIMDAGATSRMAQRHSLLTFREAARGTFR